MKHLFVTRDYGPRSGGMPRHQLELCRHVPPARLALVSTVAMPGDAEFDRGERYAIHRQPFAFPRDRLLANELRWARWLARRCQAGVDVVHSANIRPTGSAAWWARRRTGVPYVMYAYGTDILREQHRVARSAARRTVNATIFGGAAGVVAISEWSARVVTDAMRDMGVRRPPPVASIDLGTDPAQFHPSRDAGTLRHRFGLGAAPLLLTVANLVPHKGQDTTLRALALLRADFPELRYLVVGSGHYEPTLRALATELGVADRVSFAGELSDQEIAEAYATATLYVGPSRVHDRFYVEGFGISFVEAAASGIPSVAGDSGGVRSAVRDRETGLLVDPTDPAAVAGAVGALLRDPERRAAMGRAGRTAVESHYNVQRVSRETIEFAESVAASAAGQRHARR